MQGRGKLEYPEKTHRQAASSSTIPTCENPGVNPPGIKPGSTWWEASALATAPPLPLVIQYIIAKTHQVATLQGDTHTRTHALITTLSTPEPASSRDNCIPVQKNILNPNNKLEQ
ncbi:hypothetical protein PR048_033484 [Dryococelus australis]|uniref:Uncharacterized protein n=1 Tax=Dryococelus australis TaxID=614101 RepID=A0ABQ9G0E2_9NEOP|nr:hypothetical protein PR048_033484 [Dryococelus australis]